LTLAGFYNIYFIIFPFSWDVFSGLMTSSSTIRFAISAGTVVIAYPAEQAFSWHIPLGCSRLFPPLIIVIGKKIFPQKCAFHIIYVVFIHDYEFFLNAN